MGLFSNNKFYFLCMQKVISFLQDNIVVSKVTSTSQEILSLYKEFHNINYEN